MLQKGALTAAEQILAGRQSQPPYSYTTADSEALLDANQFLLGGTDVGTLSRSMTALGLSSTIPEEPAGRDRCHEESEQLWENECVHGGGADVDLDSATMNAKRIASKSAIDLVGLNEDEEFDASAPLSAGYGSGIARGFGTGGHANSSPMEDIFSLHMTMKPTRSIIVSHVSPLLTDENIQMLFQVSCGPE